MRGRFTDQGGLFSYIKPDKHVPMFPACPCTASGRVGEIGDQSDADVHHCQARSMSFPVLLFPAVGPLLFRLPRRFNSHDQTAQAPSDAGHSPARCL
jgi:hypothetical protein